MSKIFRAGVIFGFWILGQSLSAQDIVETNWYFGNSPNAFEIDKSARTATLLTDQAVPFGMGGSAVINEQFTGNLLFYSDGQLVYDGTHTLLPVIAGGVVLNGDPSLSQPAVACPFPDNTNRYYLFTNNGTTIQYTVIDASLPGNTTVPQFPLGDLTDINQPTGIADPAEVMKILQSDDGQSFWLITQNKSTFDFVVTPITATGIGTPVTHDVFPDNLPGFEAVQFAVRLDTASTVAVAPKGANRNVLLMQFDRTTGVLTFLDNVENTGFPDTGNTVIHDVEWSRDGSKLYISRTGDDTNAGNLYQINFADTVNFDPYPVVQVLPYSFYRSYGLKRGIDNRIYHLYQLNDASSPYRLGRIIQPDSVAESVFYDSLAFDANFNGRQFPEFAPPYLSTNFFDVNFTYLDSCAGSATKFIALVDPLPQNYFWNFGDGAGGTGPAPIHEYEGAGGFMVSLGVELNGIFQIATLPVEIFTADSVDLGNDTTICVDEELLLSAGNDGIEYLWSTGSADSTITVDTAGTYWVEKTFANGCTAFDDIIVTEYGAQTQVSNQWYFGERAGLDFTFGAPVALADENQMFSPEGCATISDVNGDLLFYTNGSTVWNKDHLVMINGDSIGGDSTAAQSALILPFADDQTMFYIFTTEEVYGDFTFNMKMTLVDMKADSARGEVLIKNVPFIESSAEKLTASGFTGNPWLLAHEYGNNTFRAYPVTPNGIIGALYSAAGEDHVFQNERQATGYMKFAPGGNYVAVVIPGDTNYIDLLNFDIATGELSNSRLIDIEEYAPAQIYGLEFSADALKLYVTTQNTLLQYDLDSINSQDPAADIQATRFEYPDNLNFGTLQTGPDGVIYIAIDGATSVASLSNPGGDDAGATFTQSAVDLLGRTSRLGLPNFTQQTGSAGQQPGITTEEACVGLETNFTATGRDSSIEEYSWDFGDSTGLFTEQNLTHVYTTPGTYIVELTLSNRCDVDSVLTDTIQVFSIPPTPLVPADTALCGGPITLSASDTDNDYFNYYWSTGETTRSIIVSTPSVVDVAIINDDGCSSDTVTVFIAQDESFIDLGEDRIVCQNDTTALLDANDPGPIFTWTVDGIEVGDQRTQLINTATAGEFVYAVAVANEFTACIYRDTVTITVQPEPQVQQANVVPPECGMATGSFELQAVTPGGYSYDLTGPVTSSGSFDDINGALIQGLPSGSYTATITNTVSGCTNVEVLQLEDNAPFDMEAVPQNDCARTSDISINFINNLPAEVEINVVDQFGTNVFNSVNSLNTRNVRVEDLDSGTYYVEVRDLSPPNCIQTDTVQLMVSEECYLRIFIPNAFSPGSGTDLNEEFFAFPNEFVDRFQIYIYNRWGDLVYYSTDKNFRWDGKYEGQVVQQGTYVVKILFTSTLEPELGFIEQLGTVTVVR